jgi:hypothetical protein
VPVTPVIEQRHDCLLASYCAATANMLPPVPLKRTPETAGCSPA